MQRLPAKLMSHPAAGAVDRERLFERLDASECPLVWVEGPAGAGKTTLVASYLARRELPALWYHVDAGDVDAATTFSYLAQGAAAVTASQRPALPPLAPMYLLDVPGFARRFFRLFFDALPARASLVLDGFENASGGVLPELLLLALPETPPGQRLFVTSREAPPAKLAHLQAKGAMAVIGADDLSLTFDEALAIAGGDPAAPDAAVRRLHAATDGWVAGFLVLLTQLQRTGRLDPSPGGLLVGQIFYYYLNELFTQVDAQTQSLLLKTAILPEFSAAQAGMLAPEAGVDAVLAWLIRHHFFIERSGGATPVFRYHPLFREFLLRQGREQIAPEERQALQRQGAGLLLADGEAEAALSLLIEAQAWPQASRLACQLAPRLLEQGRMATVENFIAALPAGPSDVEEWLHMWRGLAALALAPERARGEMELAYTGFVARGDRVGQLLACASILDSYLYGWNDMRPVDHWADILHELLRDEHADIPKTVAMRVLSSIAVLIFRGHRHASMIDTGFKRALVMLATVDEPAERSGAACFIILVHYLRGEWHAGLRFAAEIEPTLPAEALMPQNLAFWHAMKARLLVWVGEFEAAFAASEHAERVAAEHQIRVLAAITASAGVFAGVNADDPARAEACLARMRARVVPSRRLDVATVDLQTGLVALARGNLRQAVEDLRAAVEKAEDNGADLLAAQFRIVLGVALVQSDEHAAAADSLQRVVDYARASGIVMLEQCALMVRAWLAHRRGAEAEALALLRVALPLGRERSNRVIFPWVSRELLQDLGLAALQHGIEPDYVRELIRARRVPPPSPDADAWPWRIRVFTLGRFELLIDDRPLLLAAKAPRKPLELLKALVALGGPDGAAVGALQDQLWPDLDGAAAQNAFNVALHRLRKLLGDDPAVLLHEGRVRLDPLRVWTDVDSFRRVTDRIGADDAQALAARLPTAYPGHFLADDGAPWAAAQRERLRSRFTRAATLVTDQLEQAGRLDAVVDLQRQLIEVDPLGEAAHCTLMRCLHALGRQAEALAAYQRCRDLLWRLQGVRPSAETERLRQAIGM